MIVQVLGMLLAIHIAETTNADCSLRFSELNNSISTVICPAGCWRNNHDLCGTGKYGEGPVCLAAIHAGKISDYGGVAYVYETSGLNSSKGSLRHGVRSSTCGPKDKAYTFEMTCNTTGNTEFAVTKVTCPSNCQSHDVCGSDVYGSNSSVCAAAIHAGVLGTTGGKVKFYKHQSRVSYNKTSRNNVTTSSCGPTKASFTFMKLDSCASNPCQNGGKCTNLIVEYQCTCPWNYGGTNCEYKDLCTAESCRELQSLGQNRSGAYQIYVERLAETIPVYCDQETDGGGWMVIQRRTDGSEDFFRNWTDYRQGFGNKSNEFWLGLDLIHELTTSHSYELRVDMEDFENQTAYAKYSTFRVGSAANNFRLEVGGYSGDAGDSLNYSNGEEFSTQDRDHDGSSNRNCANDQHGAWWYMGCANSNLNGEYLARQTLARGIWWWYWKSSLYSLKRVEMKIRLL